MTETAWKSSIRRGRPRWPMRISVWTEPGRWMTRMTRPTELPVSTTGAAAACDAAFPDHPPNSRSARATQS